MATETVAERIRRWALLWWEGVYVPPPPPLDPDSGVIVFTLGHYERRWSSRLAHWLWDFWLKEWRTIVQIALSLLALFVAAKLAKII